jgi:hypothetical protein
MSKASAYPFCSNKFDFFRWRYECPVAVPGSCQRAAGIDTR